MKVGACFDYSFYAAKADSNCVELIKLDVAWNLSWYLVIANRRTDSVTYGRESLNEEETIRVQTCKRIISDKTHVEESV